MAITVLQGVGKLIATATTSALEAIGRRILHDSPDVIAATYVRLGVLVRELLRPRPSRFLAAVAALWFAGSWWPRGRSSRSDTRR